ncbi:MAG TPA: diguanylate cyclase response regulator [Actinomycetota bacterium]|nr:diguanylate cyclase response regulator [Actinomycetota bacterium]
MRILFLGGGRPAEELLGAAAAGATVETTTGLGETLRRLDEAEFDVVVVDLTTRSVTDPVPAIGGAAPRTPVVVLTGAGDEEEGLRAIRAGAQDDVALELPPEEGVRRRLEYAIERKRREQGLARHAHYDPLTDLANRALFRERLAQATARADRTGKIVAVLWLDLDGFKDATEGWPRERSDEVIRQAGVRLHRSVRQVDTVGRPAGDEFTILLEGLGRPAEAEVVARKIAAAFREPLLKDPETTLSASVGIASYPASPADAVLQHAFEALRSAKRTARGSFRFHE